MTKFTDNFFTDEVSIKRKDGHVSNDLIPVGTHVYEDLADLAVHALVPPADAVAFYGNLIVGGGIVRYTIDGVTNPTNLIGFNSLPAGSPVFIKPGTELRVKASATGAAINVQWLGTV